jgi:hypothetical protein
MERMKKMSATPLYLEWSSRGVGNLQEVYRSIQNKAVLEKIYAFLSQHSRSLLDLTTEVSQRKIIRQHYAGVRTVPLSRIKGSEGRSSDFDCDFNPLHARTRNRWISIAIARCQGDTLPLVELIQLGEDYFVRDGHHRISVAHAFSEEYIDAVVIVLELELVSTSLPTLTVANTPTTFGVESIQQT